MKSLRYTLVTDGGSDQALLPILDWLLRQHLPDTAFQKDWADLRGLPQAPATLTDKIVDGVRLFPCDILFVHRDAERESREKRVEEIQAAYKDARQRIPENRLPKIVCAIPVRMMEAWLLFDESSLRRAAGNPGGRAELHLPSLSQIENLLDPKNTLYDLFRAASGLSGRRLKQFRPQQYVHRLAEQIDDFSPLRCLSAFQALEQDIARVVVYM